MTISAKLEVRPACLADIPDLAKLDEQIFGPISYPRFVFRQLLDLVGEGLIVGIVDRQIVGYALIGLQRNDRTAYFMSLGVAQSHHRRGYGLRLAEVSIENLKDTGAESVKLTVEPKNVAAIAMYKKLGFVEVGREAEYFGENEERAIMCATLAPQTRQPAPV